MRGCKADAIRALHPDALKALEHDAALKWEYGKEVWNLALRLAAGETWTPGLMNPELQQKMEQALARRLAQERLAEARANLKSITVLTGGSIQGAKELAAYFNERIAVLEQQVQ